MAIVAAASVVFLQVSWFDCHHDDRHVREAQHRPRGRDDVEKAAQEFTDGLGGPGTGAKRSPAQRQILPDNMGTGVDSGERGNISCADIAKFDFPILTLTGERSPKRYAEAFAAAHRCNAAVPVPIVISNAAHAMNRENPELFNAAVLEFLTAH